MEIFRDVFGFGSGLALGAAAAGLAVAVYQTRTVDVSPRAGPAVATKDSGSARLASKPA